jgi:chemotaxis protein MotB
MAGSGNAAPVIIKRKKVIAGGGHHGGAWKVAYADFVTAMMAFFMLMWLLNATTEKQRKGLADYFSPTIPVNRISGGGDGAFGGNSVLTDQAMAQNGTGMPSGTTAQPLATDNAAGPSIGGQQNMSPDDVTLAAAEEQLRALSGESMVSDRVLRHITTRLTDEGLVIEVFDTPDAPLFDPDTAQPAPILSDIATVLADVLVLAANQIAVNGHVRAYPAPLRQNPTWDLSTARALATRILLEQAGVDAARMQRVTGFADRKPATPDPAATRNNRLEVILLRRTP